MMERVREVMREGMEAGLHIGAQVYVSRKGEVLMDEAMGWAREGVAMRRDTLMLWLSAGKPVTAVAVGILVERGKLGWEDRVAEYIPEFAAGGKEGITVRHLLTHTGGFRGVDAQYPFLSWEETVGRICAMRLERGWVPGEKAGYHTHSSWYILGELVRRLDGRRVEAFVREEIFLRWGMGDTWMAMEGATYAGYGERVGELQDTTVRPARGLANYDTELGAGRARPSASVRGPVRELGRFYEAMMGGGCGVLRGETVGLMTGAQRVGMVDETFRQRIDWGLGFIVNSSQYGAAIPYQFGELASAGTYGHGGSQSSVGMCDGEKGLVVAAVFNGCAGEAAHDKRLRGFLRAVYEGVGFRERR